MNDKADLLLLFEVQQLDTAIDSLRRQYASLDRGQAEQIRYVEAKSAHQEAEEAQSAIKALLLDLDLELKGVEAKRSEEETRLYSGKVRAAKELQALQDEVDSLKRRRELIDEKVLIQMDAMEQCKARFHQTKTELDEVKGRLKEKKAGSKKEDDTIKAQYQELSRQRNSIASEVPAKLLERYDKLRPTKGGLAVVAIEDGNSCGGCRMGLPSSVVVRVKEGHEIVLCDNCSRMLVKK